MAGAVQNLSNHVKYDPPFHFFLGPVLLINLVIAVVRLARHPNFDTGWIVVLSITAVVALFKMRTYPLKVQDRVIRLEERLRLALLAPETVGLRTNELSERQLVALRFASDTELPALAEKTVRGNLKPAEIKKAIVNWRADHFRV